jgi:hypothetical protein
MKNTSLPSIVILFAVAAFANVAWAPAGVPAHAKRGAGCVASQTDLDPYHAAENLGLKVNPNMAPQFFLVAATGCEGCELSDTIVETYCESRGTDCDGLLGWDESYEWVREKYLYQCGTPGQPGYGWFVQCSTWAMDGCCNNGDEGLPPTNCTHPGAAGCFTRIEL